MSHNKYVKPVDTSHSCLQYGGHRKLFLELKSSIVFEMGNKPFVKIEKIQKNTLFFFSLQPILDGDIGGSPIVDLHSHCPLQYSDLKMKPFCVCFSIDYRTQVWSLPCRVTLSLHLLYIIYYVYIVVKMTLNMAK